eukprot:1143162-Pelagomonas_calceolata.AAC.3
MMPDSILASHEQVTREEERVGAVAHYNKRAGLSCCVHGHWTDALNWRGTANFLLQGLGGLLYVMGFFTGRLDWAKERKEKEKKGLTLI